MGEELDVDDIRVLLDALPPPDELHLLILKGHLITEQLIVRYIEVLAPNPRPILEQARMSFSMRARIAEALDETLETTEKHMWEPIRRLNKIRNSLAHELRPSSLDQQMDGLIDNYERRRGAWRPREYRMGSKATKLRYAIAGLHQFMAGAITVMRENRATHGDPLHSRRERRTVTRRKD